MSPFKFKILVMRDSTPQEWLREWAVRPRFDETEYRDLIANYKSLSDEYLVRIGRWKDDANTEGRWKANVASVAYQIWMQAAQELRKCPEESEVEVFLDNWFRRLYTDVFPNKSVKKCFGLARATTLLHFLSGGRFPIFDKWVRTAIARLCNSRLPPNTVRWYLDSFCPLFTELAVLCETEGDLRMLDKALFSYGSSEKLSFSK
jgi:hypothetical protein